MFFFAFSLYAQDDMSNDEQDDMAAWTEFMTPGDHHKILEHAAGEWTYVAKYWEAPGTDAMESEGNSTGKMLYEGRYLKTSYTGNFFGMAFEGMSIEGYDNAKEEFVSIWIDNMGTGIATAAGHYDMDKKELTYEGTTTNPMTKEDAWFKQVIHANDDGTILVDMYSKLEDGSEFKMMEFLMTKK